MVSEERIAVLDELWDREDPYDPETLAWRDELDAEEAALVASWDERYCSAIGTLAEDILGLGGR